MTVTQCYAPTNDAFEVDKGIFYELLQEAVDTTAWHDIIIISGDMMPKWAAIIRIKRPRWVIIAWGQEMRMVSFSRTSV